MDEIKNFLSCDTLAYLSRERMLEIFGEEKEDFCTACFDGKYPVARPGMDIVQSELFEQFLTSSKE
jgi:amidophosphoribosyltransferase